MIDRAQPRRCRYLLLSTVIASTFVTGVLPTPNAHAADSDLLWSRQLGGAGVDVSQAIAVDSAGNVFTAGLFTGTADFDPGAGTFNMTAPSPHADAFVSKLDAAGNFVWARQAGGADNEEAYGVALDASGNVYVVGKFLATTDFDPGAGTFNLTAFGSTDVFVWKLDSAGNLVWARQLGGTDIDIANDVAVDSVGNVYTTGYFSGTADFDPGPGTSELTSLGLSDAYLSKLDTAGNFVWVRRVGGTTSDGGDAVAVDPSGNVHLAGNFSGTADFDPGSGTSNLAAVGGNDAFALKLDTAGLLVWARGWGGSGFEAIGGIAVDPSGAVHTSGNFSGTVDFDPGLGTANLIGSGQDVFVSKLDVNGTFVWAKQLTGAGLEAAYDIAVDAASNVYTVGYFTLTTDFDPGGGTQSLTSAGSNDAFASKLDSLGNFLWAKKFGGAGDDRTRGLAVDAASNVFVTGEFEVSGDFDPGPGTTTFTSAGNEDTFVSKLIGPYEYVSVVPARLMDTRTGGSTVDHLFEGIGARTAGSTTELQVTGRAGVAADSVAVALNITVTGATGAGFVTVYPCGAAQPNASNLNFGTGDTIPNLVITQLGTGGKVCVFTDAATHLIADLAGFYPIGSVYTPLVPGRLLDTRTGGSTVDGTFQGIGARSAGSTTELQVTGRHGVPADAAAVVLNVTVTSPQAPGFVTVYPCGAAQPNASNLNFVAGDTIPNLVITQVGTGGKVCLFTDANTHLIADVNGYYPTTTNYESLVPGRLLDTRTGGSTVDGTFQGIGIRTGGSTTELQVTGRHGVPADADTAVLNITVTAPTGAGFVTVYPCGAALPNASNLNFVAGDTIPNLVITRIGTGGKVCLFTYSDTHLIADVEGYYTA